MPATRQPDAAEWRVIARVFDELIELPAEQQTERLARSPLEPFLREQVASLLAAAAGDGVLDGTVSTDANVGEAPTSLAPGAAVGGFRVDRLIGRGGMGEVYEAHRAADDFEQRVALKLLRPEAVERSGLFDRERRVLARLEHPGIARLIDGGVAPDGRLFMAMEYVEGQPIDAWCKARGADLETRLRLFREVCAAVAYAHANLIVHRDLKPSNILVDGDGRVRLLDFGVARVLDEASGAGGEELLTPEYASPEQLSGEGAAPTVATDVFALGVILFELLTGRSPWSGSARRLPTAVRRVLRTDAPQASRSTGADGVPAARIAGDLDAIVGKAMRPDPAGRYRSVAELGDDVGRHLALHPVEARAGSSGYRFGRYARRHRWAVGAAAAAVGAVLVGTAGVAWQARAARIERDIALAEVKRSEAVSQTVTLMFRDAKDYGAGQDATVKSMLDDSSARLVSSLDRSARSATLIAVIADLYVQLEDPSGAEVLLDKALAAGIGGDDAAETARLRLRLATAKGTMNKTAEAEPLLQQAVAVFDREPERFRADRIQVLDTRAQLARNEGDRETAIRLLSESMPEAERAYEGNPREILVRYNNLLVYLAEANRVDEMPPLFASAKRIMAETNQQRSVQALSIMQLEGVYLAKRDDTAGAERVFEQVVDLRRKQFGKSAGLAVDLFQLGRVKLLRGKAAEALPLLVEARTLAREHVGETSTVTLVTSCTLAEALAETGDTAGAEAVLRDLDAPTLAAGAKGPIRGIFLRVRAIERLQQGRLAEAKADLDAAASIFAALGPLGESYTKGVAPLRARIAAAA